WAQSSIPLRPAGAARKKGNREWLVRIDDEKIASWYSDLFQADFEIPALPPSFEIPAPLLIEAPSFRAPRADAPRDFPVMTFSGQHMSVTPLTSPDNYFDQILPLIRSAQSRIWIQQQYILANGGTAVPRLLEAIKQRASKVDVRLIVSSKF